MTTTAPISTSQPTAPLPVLGTGVAWRTGLTTMGVALAANLAALGGARLTGMDMVASGMSVGVPQVATATVVPLLIATVLLLLLRRRGARAWRLLATTGLAVGVLSAAAPLTLPAQDATGVALAVMHVVTGGLWFVMVRRAAARVEG